MKDYFIFLYHNSYSRLAFYLLLITPLFIGVYASNIEKALFIMLGTSLLFLLFGILQTLFLLMNRKLYAYKDLTKLLMITKEIEEYLEALGAQGKGVFEKAKSVEEYLPQEMIDNILEIATSRNNAIHGEPSIKNAQETLNKAKSIRKYLKRMFKGNTFLRVITYILHTIFVTFTMMFAYEYRLIGASLLALFVSYFVSKFYLNAVGQVIYSATMSFIVVLMGLSVHKYPENFPYMYEVIKYAF